MKILFISLGCDKNLVDTEMMLGQLSQEGFTFTDDEYEAEVIVVNTCCFINDDNLYYYMSLINSKIAFCMFKVLSPTLTFGPDQLKRLPIKIENADCVKKITGENISFSKTDWDSFETSWDFKKHPLI